MFIELTEVDQDNDSKKVYVPVGMFKQSIITEFYSVVVPRANAFVILPQDYGKSFYALETPGEIIEKIKECSE